MLRQEIQGLAYKQLSFCLMLTSATVTLAFYQAARYNNAHKRRILLFFKQVQYNYDFVHYRWHFF